MCELKFRCCELEAVIGLRLCTLQVQEQEMDYSPERVCEDDS